MREGDLILPDQKNIQQYNIFSTEEGIISNNKNAEIIELIVNKHKIHKEK